MTSNSNIGSYILAGVESPARVASLFGAPVVFRVPGVGHLAVGRVQAAAIVSFGVWPGVPPVGGVKAGRGTVAQVEAGPRSGLVRATSEQGVARPRRAVSRPSPSSPRGAGDCRGSRVCEGAESGRIRGWARSPTRFPFFSLLGLGFVFS
ncbi:hypothetical protein NL676_016761 [Syzygium grande]|nr:hypothetical protein NL676_016761 [Syzygium grande]